MNTDTILPVKEGDVLGTLRGFLGAGMMIGVPLLRCRHCQCCTGGTDDPGDVGLFHVD